MIKRSFWVELYASYNIGEYRFKGLEMLLPWCDIYSPGAWATGGHTIPEGSDQVVDLLSLHSLAAIMTVMTSPRKVSRRVLSVVIRAMFHWVAGCDPIMLKHVKQKNKMSYVLVAHYFAVWWRMRRIAMSFAAEPALEEAEELGIGDNPAATWWIENTPKMMCKGIVNMLGPDWAEWVQWVQDTITELDYGVTVIPGSAGRISGV
ncbi:hypothetical protein TWF694_010401 [Orbilia ellipsospora]|uniref:Uncharacterized protein n=1 Tax=Orbilia ellipsospora TaxID=2528407 RepID=A0AAV9XB40_9PEZI